MLFWFFVGMSKQRRILSFFGGENKTVQEQRPQTSRGGSDDEDESGDTDEPFVEPNAKAARRNFQSTWLEKYKWLRCDNTKGMLCSICIESSKANPFTCGCTNYRTSTLSRHIESQDHQNALKEVQMASNFQRAVVNSVTFQEKAVVSALRTVYLLSKEYIATEKYRSLLNFLKLQGCKDLENLTAAKNASYDSVQSAKEFQSVIALY